VYANFLLPGRLPLRRIREASFRSRNCRAHPVRVGRMLHSGALGGELGHANPANLRPSPLRAPRSHETLVVAVLLAAAACADVADTPSTPRSTQPPPTPTGTGVTVPAFDRGRFAAVIPLPGAGCVTVADGVLWVLDASGTVVRIDPETNGVAYGAGAAWTGNWHDNSLSRIDPETNRVVGRRSRSGSAPATWWSALAASGSPATTAWTPRPEDVVVVRIDPQTNRAVETIAVGGHPIDVAATKGAVWVSVADPGTALRIAGR
jgi:hypothetical protein